MLSDYSIFLHAHRFSWHARPMDNIIKRINYNKITTIVDNKRFAYANLNVDFFQQNTIKSEWILSAYKSHFLDILGEIDSLEGYCCAQFIVSKDTIHRRSLKFYKQLDTILKTSPLPNDIIGRLFEYIWHVIFGYNPQATPYTHGLCSIIDCTDNLLRDDFSLVPCGEMYYCKQYSLPH